MSLAVTLVLLTAVGSSAPELHRLLFVDDTLFANISSELMLRLERPQKMAPVLEPTQPWEDASGYYYNTVVRINSTAVFLYYDCGPRGTSDLGLRFTCLAISADVRGSSSARQQLSPHLTDGGGERRREASQQSPHLHLTSEYWLLAGRRVLYQAFTRYCEFQRLHSQQHHLAAD